MQPTPEANNPQRESALPSATLLEHTPPKLTLAAQVERVEFQAAQLNEMLGETIATVLVNLNRGNIRCCSDEAEKNLRAYMDSRSKWREQLMCSNDQAHPTAAGGTGGAERKYGI